MEITVLPFEKCVYDTVGRLAATCRIFCIFVVVSMTGWGRICQFTIQVESDLRQVYLCFGIFVFSKPLII